MRLQSWFSCLGVGTLVLGGMLVTGSSSIAQDATPPARAAGQTADEDNGNSVVGKPLLEPAIDLIRAQEIALEGHNGAAVIDVELGGENGLLAYSVTLDSEIEVNLDATSGEVIRTEEHDDEDDDEDDDDDDERRNQRNNDDEDEDNHDDDD